MGGEYSPKDLKITIGGKEITGFTTGDLIEVKKEFLKSDRKDLRSETPFDILEKVTDYLKELK